MIAASLTDSAPELAELWDIDARRPPALQSPFQQADSRSREAWLSL